MRLSERNVSPPGWVQPRCHKRFPRFEVGGLVPRIPVWQASFWAQGEGVLGRAGVGSGSQLRRPRGDAGLSPEVAAGGALPLAAQRLLKLVLPEAFGKSKLDPEG